jgi:hypothetical protein
MTKENSKPISFKTIQKNTTLGEFVKEESKGPKADDIVK